jgi:hypothetical protein
MTSDSITKYPEAGNEAVLATVMVVAELLRSPLSVVAPALNSIAIQTLVPHPDPAEEMLVPTGISYSAFTETPPPEVADVD